MSTNERELFLSPLTSACSSGSPWVSFSIAFETLAVATAMPTVVRALEGENLYALGMGVVMATQLMTTALAGPWSRPSQPQVLPLHWNYWICSWVGTVHSRSQHVCVCARACHSGLVRSVVPLYTLIGNNVHPIRQPAFFCCFRCRMGTPRSHWACNCRFHRATHDLDRFWRGTGHPPSSAPAFYPRYG